MTFIKQDVEIFNRPHDEMRKVRIEIRKDRHKKFREAYLTAKKALQPPSEHSYNSYDDETKTYANDSPEYT